MNTSCVKRKKDYKQSDSQHELKTTTLNQNHTQQNKNNSDEPKTRLDKMEMTLMMTIIKNEKCSKLNYYQMIHPMSTDPSP